MYNPVKIFALNFRKYSFDRYLSGVLLIILTGIALARAFQHFYIVDINEPIQYSLWWHIPFNLFMWWNWFLFVPIVYWSTIRITLDSAKYLYWFILCFILPVGVVVIRQVAASIVTVSILADKSNFQDLLFWRLFNNPWMWLDMIVYFAILIGVLVVEYQYKSKRTELKSVQLQAQLAQSQLNALKSQLHPHFLFNTLNTISTLILKEDYSEAERMLSLLNNFLRTTIFESQKQEITLKEELRFIRDYLAIEKIRFIDKLEVKEDIAKDTVEARIPSFLLQPLVENAVYHGIAPRTSNGIITITSKTENGNMAICIEDNGPGINGKKINRKNTGEGIGLKITKERLKQLYGTNYQFLIENVATGGVKVSIQIPFVIDAEMGVSS